MSVAEHANVFAVTPVPFTRPSCDIRMFGSAPPVPLVPLALVSRR